MERRSPSGGGRPRRSGRTPARPAARRRLSPTGDVAAAASFPAPLARSLESVGRDRRHSASALAERAHRAIDRWLRRAGPALAPRPTLEELAERLRDAQPGMGAFVRWADELERLARSRPATGVPARLRRWIRTERARLRAEAPRAVALAIRDFPPVGRVVTLSRSDAVRRVLLGLPDARRPAEVVVLRSLPGGEGAEMARDLRRFGLRTRIVADAEAREAVGDADLVLIGADAVMADGSLVHKVGTRALVAAARERGVPVAVVTGTSKFCRRRSLPRPSPRLFDRSPGGSISVYWTDRGRITPRQVASGRLPWLRPFRRRSRAATAPARRRGA